MSRLKKHIVLLVVLLALCGGSLAYVLGKAPFGTGEAHASLYAKEPTVQSGQKEEAAGDEAPAPIPAVSSDANAAPQASVAVSAKDHGIRYDLFDSRRQALYDAILVNVRSKVESFILTDATVEDVSVVYDAVRLDHPELFWLWGFGSSERDGAVTVTSQFTVPSDEIDTLKAQIDAVCNEALSQLPSDASDYQKLVFCHDWIVANTDSVSSVHDQTIQGVFLDHQAVCAGYVAALQYMLSKVGVRCDFIAGVLDNGESHAWSIVWIDGTPTYVDVTWGDPSLVGEDGTVATANTLPYDYLCVTSEEMYRDRTAFDPPQDRLPVCDSTAYDYYRLNGLYLETFDASALASLVWEAVDNGASSVRFKLSSWDQYEAAVSLLSSSEAFSCFPDYVTGFGYEDNPTLYTIHLSWE